MPVGYSSGYDAGYGGSFVRGGPREYRFEVATLGADKMAGNVDWTAGTLAIHDLP